MTVTNENHHYVHMKLFIHKKYLHGDMRGLAAQAHIRVQCSSELKNFGFIPPFWASPLPPGFPLPPTGRATR